MYRRKYVSSNIFSWRICFISLVVCFVQLHTDPRRFSGNKLRAYDRNLQLNLEAHLNILVGCTHHLQGSLPTASFLVGSLPTANKGLYRPHLILSCGVSTNRLQVSLQTHLSSGVSTDRLQVDRGTDEYYSRASTSRQGIICKTYKLTGITI